MEPLGGLAIGVGLAQSLNAAGASGGCERKLTTLARVSLSTIEEFGLKPLRAELMSLQFISSTSPDLPIIASCR